MLAMPPTLLPPAAAMLAYADVTVRRGGVTIIDGVSLSLPPGSFVALTGASGAGKTTLLRLGNAMVALDSGAVHVAGSDVAGQAPAQLRRRIGYASQGVGLFPHWTVAENIAAVPWLLGHDRATIAARVVTLLDLVELPRSFSDRLPRQLSGGQASRVGLARALAAAPRLLLLDEPFGALDARVRKDLRKWLKDLHRRIGHTTLFVTHDQDEAFELADRIAILNNGVIEQVGTAEDILQRPATSFVASFIEGIAHRPRVPQLGAAAE